MSSADMIEYHNVLNGAWVSVTEHKFINGHMIRSVQLHRDSEDGCYLIETVECEHVAP